MGLSVWQLLIIAAVILILFGRGKISEVMGDFGKGVSSFKKGMAEEDKQPVEPAKIEAPNADAVATKEPKGSDKSAH